MRVRGWQGALYYWLNIAATVSWLVGGLSVIYILFKYARWAAAQ
jgi:hypothetical protein